jgi:hypothetical protein
VADFYEVSGGRLRINMHPGQTAAWESERRFVFMLAGTQGGKTSWAPVWLWREMQRCGPGDYLAVTSTYPLLQLKMLPEFLRLFDTTLHLGTWRASDRLFACKDGSRVIFGSATNSESLESATAKAAWLDEVGQDQFGLDAWQAVLRRLSIHQGRVLGTTSLYNMGWLKTEVFDRWQASDPDYAVIQFESTLNPVFPKAEFERARKSLPDWKFNLQYRAEFRRPMGLIYGDYSDEIGGHRVEPFAIPAEWPRYVGIDFGAVNTATVWLAENTATKAYYLYRETLEGGLSTKEHVKAAQQRAANERVVSWHGGSGSETQQRMDWRQAGLHVQEPPVDNVESGIDKVVALLREKRLFVFSDCKGTRDQLARYRRKVDAQGQTTDAIQDKESFHYLDALRYDVLGLAASVQGSRSRGAY